MYKLKIKLDGRTLTGICEYDNKSKAEHRKSQLVKLAKNANRTEPVIFIVEY